MIKLLRSMILAIYLIAALGIPAAFGNEDLPMIELKDVKLRGTAVSGLFKPIAIIEDTVSNKNFWYREGDILCGGKILQIRRGSLVLEMNGSRYLFGLPMGAVEGIGASSSEGERRAIDLGEKTGENVWKVKLDDAIEMFTRVNELMKEARIRPYFAVGKAAGIRVDRIKKRSVVEKMGLEDGDVIKGVNGFGLMSPTKVFEAYRKYKNDNLIQVQLIRNDSPLTLTYNIIK